VDERGYTIAELIVAASMATFVLLVVFAAVRVHGRSAALQSGVADTQITARGAGELLLEDLRMAGYGMLGVAPSANVPPLSVSVAGNVTTLTLRGNYSDVSTTLAAAATSGSSSVLVVPPVGKAFVPNNLILVDSGLNSEVRTIGSVGASGGNLQISFSPALTSSYPMGPDVTQIEVVTYEYNSGTGLLRRNGQVVADNASTFNLQFIAQEAGAMPTAMPGDNVRSVLLDFVAGQAANAKLPGNPGVSSSVSTEANLRNLAFRFSLG
jgi:hypothetical protein